MQQGMRKSSEAALSGALPCLLVSSESESPCGSIFGRVGRQPLVRGDRRKHYVIVDVAFGRILKVRTEQRRKSTDRARVCEAVVVLP